MKTLRAIFVAVAALGCASFLGASVHESNTTQCTLKTVTVKTETWVYNPYSGWFLSYTSYADTTLSYGSQMNMDDVYGSDYRVLFSAVGVTQASDPNCVVETWQSFDEPQGWTYGTWSPACSTQPPCAWVSQSRTNQQVHLTGERSNLGHVRNTGSYTEYQNQNQTVAGCGTLTWTAFDEEVVGWHEIYASPCGSYWEDQQFPQYYDEERTTRTGERSQCGDERNVVQHTWLRWDSRPAQGCKPLNPRTFSEVASGWSEVDSWPDSSEYASGQAFTQYYREERTIRSGWTNDRGDVWGTSESTESRQGSRTAYGTGQPPTITAHPVNSVMTIGQSGSFSVSATGSSINYRWRKNGSNLGVTSRVLALEEVTRDSAGSYDVYVYNNFGGVTSQPATLTPNEPPVVLAAFSPSVVSPTEVHFSAAAQDFDSNLSYCEFLVFDLEGYMGWIPEGTGSLSGRQDTGTFTWSLSQPLNARLHHVWVRAYDNYGALDSNGGKMTTFTVGAASSASIVLSPLHVAPGDTITVSYKNAPANSRIKITPFIEGSQVGSEIVIAAGGTGSIPFSQTSGLSNNTPYYARMYFNGSFVVESNPVYTATEWGLTVVDGRGGGPSIPVGATVSIEANPDPDGEGFVGWSIIEGPGTIANPSARQTTFTMGSGYAAVRANYSGIPQINSPLSASAQQFVAFTHTITASNAPTSFTATNLPPGLTFQVLQNPTRGLISGTPTASGTFDVPVSASNAAGSGYGLLRIEISSTLPPGFTLHPQNYVVGVGSSASFAVAATSQIPITYQWQRAPNGSSDFSPIPAGGSYAGVTTATLTISNATLAMRGDRFRCQASNGAGPVLSNSATLIVFGSEDDGGTLPAEWPNLPDTAISKAVGITVGQLSVGKSGELTYSVPIWVSPGTAGVQPQLALNYSSQAGPGIAGYGWSISGISAITRGPQTRAVDNNVHGVDFTSDDRYYLDGQRLIAIQGADGANNAEYRTEMDSFTKVVSYGTAGSNGPAYFKAWTKSGLIIEFGNNTSVSENTRVDAEQRFGGTGSPGALVWSVSKITDTAGNYMTFTYSWDADAREQTLTQIDYTGNAAAGVLPYARVKFDYGEFSFENPRPDRRRMFVAGSRSESVRRLEKIECSGPSGLARVYELGYDQQPVSNWSVLKTITESDGGSGPGHSYQPLSFDYTKHEAADMSWSASTLVPQRPVTGTGAWGTGFVDVNSDGLPDQIAYLQNSNAVDVFNEALINSGTGFSDSAAWHLSSPIGINGRGDQGKRFLDVNGDGYVDFVNGHYNGKEVWLNRLGDTPAQEGWRTEASYTLPTHIVSEDGNPAGGAFVDVNADGFPDLVISRSGTQGAYFNTGSGWNSTLQTAWTLPKPDDGSGLGVFLQDSGKDNGVRFTDLNGDGLPDVLQGRRNSTGTWLASRAWLNSGTCWVYARQYNPPEALVRDEYPAWGVELIDVNRDGLTDLVAHHWNGGALIQSTWLNTGDGWTSDAKYKAAYPLAVCNNVSSGAKVKAGSALVDLTQDGIPSQIWLRGGVGGKPTQNDRGVSFGLSYGFGPAVETGAFVPALGLLAYDNDDRDRYSGIGGQIIDVDGDGAPDLVWNNGGYGPDPDSQVPMPSPYTVSGALRNTTPRPNLLRTVTNGFGVSATVVYAPLTERSGSSFTVYDKGTGGPTGTVNIIGPMYVVKSVSNDDGVGGSYSLDYRYAGLRSHRIYGNLGFEKMTVVDARTEIQTETTYAQEYPFIGLPIATTTISGSVTLNDKLVVYGEKSLNGGKTRFVFAQDTDETTKDLNGDVIGTTSTSIPDPSTDVDDYGNIKKLEVATGDGFSKTTDSVYTNDPVKWYLGRLTRSTVTAVALNKPTLVRKSAFSYYDTTTGLLKEEIIEPKYDAQGNPAADGLDTLRTSYSYDDFGNKTTVTVTGWNGVLAGGEPVMTTRTTTTTYNPADVPSGVGTNGRLPQRTTNSVGHPEIYTYDQNLGVIKTLKGPNNLTTSWDYDGFGARTRETRADTTVTNIYTKWAGSVAPSGAKYFVETTTTGAAPSLAFYDAMGRPIRSVTLDGAGDMIYQDTRYDSMGRAYKVSVPYRPGATTFWIHTTLYDLLNRPKTVQTPHDESGAVATTSFTYEGLTTKVTDAKDRVAWTVKNGQGWVTKSIRNATAAADALDRTEATYDYDAFGNLTQTIAAGVQTDIAYDVRGRKQTMKDADMGGTAHTWSYIHNAFGELVSQTDANGNITTMTYDALGRMKTRSVDTEGTTTWTYDTATDGKGKLHMVSVDAVVPAIDYSETHTYDAKGRPEKVTRVIDGATYEIGQTYDASSRPETMVYPTGFQTKNVYNAFGFVKEIRRADGTTNALYWKADTYAVDGRVNGETYGNGVTADRGYDAASGRLYLAAVGLGTDNEVQYLSYAYDAMGNVTVRKDDKINREERFNSADTETDGYDGLDRLRWHRVISGPTVEVRYDQKGNITYKSDVGTYGYNGSDGGPHAVTGISGGPLGIRSYHYDFNGNMTLGGGRSIAWTSFGQIKSVTQGSFTSAFQFGAMHERVKQVAQNGETIYVGGIWERYTSGGTAEERNYVMAPTGRIAVAKFGTSLPVGGKLEYFHTDGLGSITAVTDETGTVVKRFAYDAWGKRTDPATGAVITSSTNGNTVRGFTDHEHLDDLGLVHMNGRVFDPVLGRFLSADPFVGDPVDAQEYNRYSYLANNPLGGTDPTGYFSLRDAANIAITVAIAYVSAGSSVYAVSASSGKTLAESFAAVAKGHLLRYQAIAAGAGAGFGGGFASSLLNGGSVTDAFKSGVIGGFVGGVTAGALHDIGAAGLPWFERGLAHGLVQGVATEAIGGEFRHGFYAGFAVGGAEKAIGAWASGSSARGIAVAAVLGGTASALGGGKFANGAVSGAFSYLFNALSRSQKFDVLFYNEDSGDLPMIREFARKHGADLMVIKSNEDVEIDLRRLVLDEGRYLESVAFWDHADRGFFGFDVQIEGKDEFWRMVGKYVHGDIYIIGCHVAAGPHGRRYIDDIAETSKLTAHGTPHFVSITSTGHAVQALTRKNAEGGVWVPGFPWYTSKGP